MAEYIECRDCDSRSCTGCNTYVLSQMLHAGKLDGIMDEHHTILAVDVAPVVHGKWVEREDFNNDVYYDCSACGESFCFIEGVPEDNFYSYCPNCGAKMDGE